jgi:hypothetical protein
LATMPLTSRLDPIPGDEMATFFSKRKQQYEPLSANSNQT